MPGPDSQHSLGLVIIPLNSSSCFSALCTDIFKSIDARGLSLKTAALKVQVGQIKSSMSRVEHYCSQFLTWRNPKEFKLWILWKHGMSI